MSDNLTAGASATDRGEPMSLGEFRGHEIYPMPMFVKLAVQDVAAITAWYEQALGFATVFHGPVVRGQTALVHLRRRKYQDLLIVPAQSTAIPSAVMSVTFNAEGEVDDLAARARSVAQTGASSVEGPVATPWNTRDLKVTDPAGNHLVFTARNPNPDPEEAARIQSMFKAAQKKNE